MDELDVHGQAPELTDGESSSRGRGLIWTALALGAAGVILGVTGIVQANKTNTEILALRKELASRPDPTESLRAEIRGIDERIANVGAEAVRANNTLRTTRDQMQSAFARLSEDVRNNREQINKNTEALAAVASRATATAAPARSTASEPALVEGGSGGNSATTEAASGANGGATVHTIQSGDTFARLATRYGVSLQAIIQANPGVDPGRLQIGQKVNIP